MTLQYSEAVRDAQNDALETEIGTAPTLELWTGNQPANCAAADSGTKIAEGTLPSDWLGDSSAGVKSKAGAWTVTGLAAAGTGTAAGHFRVRKTGVVHMQGDVVDELDMDNVSVAEDQVVTVNAAAITRGNA